VGTEGSRHDDSRLSSRLRLRRVFSHRLLVQRKRLYGVLSRQM
jgi:hypothetical protein